MQRSKFYYYYMPKVDKGEKVLRRQSNQPEGFDH
jgi:hypothetical protein